MPCHSTLNFLVHLQNFWGPKAVKRSPYEVKTDSASSRLFHALVPGPCGLFRNSANTLLITQGRASRRVKLSSDASSSRTQLRSLSAAPSPLKHLLHDDDAGVSPAFPTIPGCRRYAAFPRLRRTGLHRLSFRSGQRAISFPLPFPAHTPSYRLL